MKTRYPFKKIVVLIVVLLTQINFTLHSQNVSANQLLADNKSQVGFEENKGQISGLDAHKVKFMIRDKGITMFLLDNGIAYQFDKTHYPEGYKTLERSASIEENKKMDALAKDIRTETYRMDITLVGINSNPKITQEGKSQDYIQYYNHNILDVHNYTKVIYHDVYPKIDWVIYKSGTKVKYDFVVHPGGNPNQIQLKTSWVENLQLNQDGGITLKNRLGEITEQNPISFQNNKEIKTQFQKLKDDVIAFQLADYNPNQILIIDPTLQWATYYGGRAVGVGLESFCATDTAGNVFLAGTTNNTTTIASGGYQNTYMGGASDGFLVKFNSAGVRQWATYYGGGGHDVRHTCVADGLGNVYLAGQTEGIPTTPGAHQTVKGGSTFDAYIVKFDASGVRQWATYYGGTDGDYGYACAVDNDNNVYLAGGTTSANNISSGGHDNSINGGSDAFLVKFDPNGVRLWGTYYGGAGTDEGYSCVVDGNNNVYLTGYVYRNSSTGIAAGGFQMTHGDNGVTTSVRDAFLVKFNSAGVRLWGTYYGGIGDDTGYSCAVDGNNNVYIAGVTESTNNIASGGHQNTFTAVSDAFLVKFDASGARLWGTYYGGSEGETALSCRVDGSNNVYLAGKTNSTSNIAIGGHQNTLGGNGYSDAFLVKFDPAGVRQWGTYYGKNGSDYGKSCAIDNNGDVYLAGSTQSGNMALNGHDNTFVGPCEEFLAKFNGIACTTSAQPSTISGNNTLCAGATQTYSVTNDATATSYTWTLPSGWSGASTTNSITITAGTTGGTISVTANNGCGSSTAQTLATTINNAPAQPSAISGNNTLCAGASQTYSVTNDATATSYTWILPGGWSGTSTTNSIIVTVGTSTGSITVMANNECGSSIEQTLSITVNPLPTVEYIQTPDMFCENHSAVALTGGTPSGGIYGGTGVNAGNFDPGIAGIGIHIVTYSYTDGNNCSNTDMQQIEVDACAGLNEQENEQVTVYPNPFANNFTISFTDSGAHTIELVDVLGKQIRLIETQDQNTVISTKDLSSGTYYLKVIDENLIFKLIKN
ncbi:MAG: SBBP repeat-containing protein [Cyclobacteriaceae bacterium]|nr:SBBP repeat-containing protein [Cyclobacteriaceae bacterium]